MNNLQYQSGLRLRCLKASRIPGDGADHVFFLHNWGRDPTTPAPWVLFLGPGGQHEVGFHSPGEGESGLL